VPDPIRLKTIDVSSGRERGSYPQGAPGSAQSRSPKELLAVPDPHPEPETESGWLAIGTAPNVDRAAAAPNRTDGIPLGELEAGFERALGAIHLVFQPIVEGAHRGQFGFEALVRTQSELLPDPGALLDAAERLHRVERLGRAIRRHVAADFASADDALGAVFVNLHALDLADRSLASPYSPLWKLRDRVVLEITERASLEAVADARYRVAALREMGYRVAIDDLGAGHSRMNRFTLQDTDFVKLDMSLVRDLHKHRARQRSVSSIIAMCRDQGIRVVGEGVETEAECDTLLALGCDLLQGFLIARPSRQLAPYRGPL
jgi:EAL domain-containing protein (putative c-di-GMP-specific phosphodiesterase class I)